MKRSKPFFPAPFVLLCAVVFAGCAGLVEKSGEILDGSVFAEKTLAVYRSEKKGEFGSIELKELLTENGLGVIELTSSEWPGLALRGTIPSANGTFFITGARILSTHIHGWNEFNLDLLGSAVFYSSGGMTGNLRIPGEIERVQISAGNIRLKGSRLTGDAALSALKNRRERILALVDWMLNNEIFLGLPFFANQEQFEIFWKPKILPELAGKENRPSEYSTINAEWRRSDSVRWNLKYTELIFPEELRELRNSGALMRDWEEALPWIYIEYSWNHIIESFSEIILHKVN